MVTDWLNFLIFDGMLLLGELLVIVALLHMIYQRKTPSSMIAWMLAIVMLPHLAVPFYFIVGSRKRSNRYSKAGVDMRETEVPAHENPIDGILRSNGIPGATSGNHLRLILDGTEAYATLINAIQQATKSIWISTYVFKTDDVTAQITDALIAKRREGVEVKVLIDAVTSSVLKT